MPMLLCFGPVYSSPPHGHDLSALGLPSQDLAQRPRPPFEGLPLLSIVGVPIVDCSDAGSDTGYTDTMRQLDACVGLDRLRALHLNDSKTPLGSRVDRHTHIGSGHVGLSAFRRLLTDPRLEDLPMVLETPKARSGKTTEIEPDPMDLENLGTLRDLIGREAR